MGATTSSADNYILPTLVNQLLGTRMQVVTGYSGQNEIFLAVERGEVQGNNAGLSNVRVNRGLAARGQGPHPAAIRHRAARDLPDVPTAMELASTESDRALFRLYAAKFTMARPLVLPPDVPAERIAALREAFDATMKDPQYIEEAKRIGLDVNPLGGEAIAS